MFLRWTTPALSLLVTMVAGGAVVCQSAAAPIPIQVDVQSGQLAVLDGPHGRVFDGGPITKYGSMIFPFTDEPGFVAPPGTLNANQAIGFDLVGPLMYWDGAAWDNAVPGDEQIAPMSLVSTDTFWHRVDENFKPGFTFAQADASGGLNQQLAFGVKRGGPNLILVMPANGAYSVDLVLTSSQHAASEPFTVVFNKGLSEAQVEDAIQAVPEPASWLLLVVGGLMVCCVAWRAKIRRKSTCQPVPSPNL